MEKAIIAGIVVGAFFAFWFTIYFFWKLFCTINGEYSQEAEENNYKIKETQHALENGTATGMPQKVFITNNNHHNSPILFSQG